MLLIVFQKKINKGFKSKNRTLIVDASAADSDINFRSKKVTKKSIKDKDYKWARKQHQVGILALK